MNINMFGTHIFHVQDIRKEASMMTHTYRKIASDGRYIFTLWFWQVFQVVDDLLKKSFQTSIYVKSHHSRGSQQKPDSSGTG
jgi:hypothetical protein